jgi:type II secretory pathway pseudopilin PulG
MKGYTLVEMVLVIGLISITSISLGGTVLLGAKQMRFYHNRYTNMTQLRSAIELMTQEIRLIETKNNMNVIGPTTLTFEYPAGTSISFSLNGTNLERNGVVLASNITSFSLEYYDKFGNVANQASKTVIVRIRMTADAPGNDGEFKLKTDVYIRNIGKELDAFGPHP